MSCLGTPGARRAKPYRGIDSSSVASSRFAKILSRCRNQLPLAVRLAQWRPPRGTSSRCRVLASLAGLAIACGIPAAVSATGAPRDGDRFVNPAGPRPLPGAGEMFPFLLRKTWTSVVGRDGRAPRRALRPRGAAHNPSVTWIGHATFLVRMDGVTFLTDPIFSERASPVSLRGAEAARPAGGAAGASAAARLRHVSHDHYDHTDLAVDRGARARGARFVAARAGRARPRRRRQGHRARLVAERHASARAGSLRAGAALLRPRLTERRRGACGPDGSSRGRRGASTTAGDTGYFDGFREIRERLGPIDLAALPIGAYDPAAIMQFVHMNPEEAMQAAVDLGARRASACTTARSISPRSRSTSRRGASTPRRDRGPSPGAGLDPRCRRVQAVVTV